MVFFFVSFIRPLIHPVVVWLSKNTKIHCFIRTVFERMSLESLEVNSKIVKPCTKKFKWLIESVFKIIMSYILVQSNVDYPDLLGDVHEYLHV